MGYGRESGTTELANGETGSVNFGEYDCNTVTLLESESGMNSFEKTENFYKTLYKDHKQKVNNYYLGISQFIMWIVSHFG